MEEVHDKGDAGVKPKRLSYRSKVKKCNVIAKPMAHKKLGKKIYKLIKKASKHKNFFGSGLEIVEEQLRLGERGLVFFAGDISPKEIMCNLPAVCAAKNIPFCFIPSRDDIGAAMGKMTGCTIVLVQKHEAYSELYDRVKKHVKLLARS